MTRLSPLSISILEQPQKPLTFLSKRFLWIEFKNQGKAELRHCLFEKEPNRSKSEETQSPLFLLLLCLFFSHSWLTDTQVIQLKQRRTWTGTGLWSTCLLRERTDWPQAKHSNLFLFLPRLTIRTHQPSVDLRQTNIEKKTQQKTEHPWCKNERVQQG